MGAQDIRLCRQKILIHIRTHSGTCMNKRAKGDLFEINNAKSRCVNDGMRHINDDDHDGCMT